MLVPQADPVPRVQNEHISDEAAQPHPENETNAASRLQDRSHQRAPATSGSNLEAVCSCTANKIIRVEVCRSLIRLKPYLSTNEEARETAIEFLHDNRIAVHYAATHTKHPKGRLCYEHAKHLAKALDMVVGNVKYWELIKRISKAANHAASMDDWDEQNV
jgi:hypothetical protein